MRRIILITQIAILSTTTLYSQTQNPILDSISVEVIIKEHDFTLQDAKIQLYKVENLIFEKMLYENTFSFKVPMNELCTLVVLQNGFIGKCIVFNMYANDEFNCTIPFELEIKPISKSLYETGDLLNMDYPEGIVKIDEEKNELYYEDVFSDHIWQHHKSLLDAKANVE